MVNVANWNDLSDSQKKEVNRAVNEWYVSVTPDSFVLEEWKALSDSYFDRMEIVRGRKEFNVQEYITLNIIWNICLRNKDIAQADYLIKRHQENIIKDTVVIENLLEMGLK